MTFITRFYHTTAIALLVSLGHIPDGYATEELELCQTPFSPQPLAVLEGACNKFINGVVVGKTNGDTGPLVKCKGRPDGTGFYKAGKNDCESHLRGHGCGGHGKEGDAEEWALLPQGVCTQIGGTLAP